MATPGEQNENFMTEFQF